MVIEIRHQDALLFDFGQSRRPDIMICDPPYSAHVHKSAVSHTREDGSRKRDLGFEHLSPKLRRKIADFASSMRGWSLIYTDTESVGYWKISLESAGAEYVRSIPWVRWSMPQLSGDRPPQGHEMVIIAHSKRTRMKWWGAGNFTHLAHLALRGEGKHKAEKPLDQLLDLVSWFSAPKAEWKGGREPQVFDPTSGSGTTAQACRILGRDFLGFELQEKWVKRAQTRVTSPLGERDTERYARWVESRAVWEREQARMKKHTDSVR